MSAIEVEECDEGLPCETKEAAEELAAAFRRNAPVFMYAAPCGDHWHVRGVA